MIVNTPVSKVNASKMFAVLADETIDIAGKERLSLCVWYIDNETLSITENFLNFELVILLENDLLTL